MQILGEGVTFCRAGWEEQLRSPQPSSLELLPSSFHPASLNPACLSFRYPRGSRPKFPGVSMGKKRKPSPWLLSAPTLSFCPEFVATRAAPRSPQAQTLEKPVPPARGREGEGKTRHLGLKMVPTQTRKLYSQLSKFPICNSEHAKTSRR